MSHASLGMEESGRLYRLVVRGISFDEAYLPGEEPSGVTRGELRERYQREIGETKENQAQGLAWDFPHD